MIIKHDPRMNALVSPLIFAIPAGAVAQLVGLGVPVLLGTYVYLAWKAWPDSKT